MKKKVAVKIVAWIVLCLVGLLMMFGPIFLGLDLMRPLSPNVKAAIIVFGWFFGGCLSFIGMHIIQDEFLCRPMSLQQAEVEITKIYLEEYYGSE